MNTVTYSPLIRWEHALKGLLAGSLVVSGVLSPVWLGFQAVLFFMGVFIFIDSFVPNGGTSFMATIIFTVIGGVVSLVFFMLGVVLFWAVPMVVIAVLLYLYSFSRRRNIRNRGKDKV